jgi:hypothetical protein
MNIATPETEIHTDASWKEAYNETDVALAAFEGLTHAACLLVSENPKLNTSDPEWLMRLLHDNVARLAANLEVMAQALPERGK